MSELEEDRVSKIWELWENSRSFLNNKQDKGQIEKFFDFMEGRHWGNVAGQTKNLPRVTINQTEMIVNSRVSGILASKIKTTFFSDINPARAEELTRFHRFIEKEIKAEEIYEDIVEEGAVVGSKLAYFYWDEDASDNRGKNTPGMKMEGVDILNFAVHNPLELNLQKQKWIILASRQEVEDVKKLCENKSFAEKVVADDEEPGLTFTQEQDGSDFVTVLTKFFRDENGEVYFEKATRTTVIHGPRPLNPHLVKLRDKVENPAKQEPQEPEDDAFSQYKASLYPMALYTYKKRKGSIYGRGEVEPIVQNNKVVNFCYSMMAKSIEDLGFGNIVARKGATSSDRISNDPTKLLIDKYTGAGNGFYSINKQPFQAQVPSAINSIMDSTRSVTGSTEVMTGEVMGANQSGTSIAFLQQQAQKPLSKLIGRYMRFREDCGRVFLQFYVLHYKNKQYTYAKDEVDHFSMKKEDAVSEQQANIQTFGEEKGADMNINQEVFNGKEYAEYDFDITCEAGPGSQWSEVAELNMLEIALSGGHIDFESFIKAYPSHLITNKDALLNGINEKKQGVIAGLQAQLQQQQQLLAQYGEYIKQQEATVSKANAIIRESKAKEKQFIELQTEYTNKLGILNNKLAEVNGDAQEFAQKIYNDQLSKQGAE